MQANAAQSSWVPPSPETPARQRTFRPSSLPSVSLTFVPNPSGIGGVLVPTAAKPHRKSSSPSAPKSDPDSPSEEAGSLDSDSTTSSPESVLTPIGFITNDHKALELSAAPPLKPTFIESELPQASSSYSTLKPSPALSTPKLSQTDSCMSESFLLNHSAISGNANGAAMRIGTQAWSPQAAVQQLQAACPSVQFDSPASGQFHQSQLYMPAAPPQLASFQQFLPQPQSLQQSSPLPGGLSSPLLSGTSTFSYASKGVPSLAMGHPASLLPPPPPADQSFRSPLCQYPQQLAATSAADFEFDFDLLCDPMPSVTSNLSMRSSAPPVSLCDSSRTDPTSFSRMGSPLPCNLPGAPQGGLEGLLPDSVGGSGLPGLGALSQAARNHIQPSSLLPSYRQQCLGGSTPNLVETQTAPQSPFTFVPARCTSHSQCYSSAASPLSQSMQSQVLVHCAQLHCRLSVNTLFDCRCDKRYTFDLYIYKCEQITGMQLLTLAHCSSSLLHCPAVTSCLENDLCQVFGCSDVPVFVVYRCLCDAQPWS